MVPTSSSIIEWVVAQEDHADGSQHLHAFIRYEKKTEFQPRKWDILIEDKVFHGNYQVARSWDAVRTYCSKGGNFISSFDVFAAQRKKSCGRELNKRILEEDLTDLVKEGVVRFQDYLRVKACKEAFLRDMVSALPRCEGFISNDFDLFLPLKPHPKKFHLWFWSSAPDKGKTTFLRSLSQKHPSYWFVYAETYQYPSADTQFVLLDEYSKAHLTVMQLNQMCDGSWGYTQKCQSSIMLKEPVIVVCSNKSPEEVYPNSFKFVLARFRVFEL